MKIAPLFLIPTILIFSSCETKTGTGALAGAGIGALAGGLIGGNATGALVGGAIGAASGALVGAALDEQDRKIMAERSPNTLDKIDRKEQLTLEDIKNMSQNGLSDKVIIGQIQNTESIFHLSTEELIELKKAGVSEAVIDYMIQTPKSN
jgi:outer membrane lipoprotein SlyB